MTNCPICNKSDKVVLINKENLLPMIKDKLLHHLYCRRCTHNFKEYVDVN